MTSTTELPTDILVSNIFTRLPHKSALRFRCVSKQWNSLLTTPLFINMHLRHVTAKNPQNHRKLLFFSAATPLSFHTLNSEALEDGLTASRSFPLVAKISERISMLSSCRGLICVGISTINKYSDMMLWNPLTGEYKTLPYPNSHKECYKVIGTKSQLYHSADDDDYKLLRITEDQHAYIYSLNSDSWRELDSMKDLDFRNLIWGTSSLQNGKIYFLDEDEQTVLGRLSYSITTFDTTTEKFTVMATPCFGDLRTDCLNSMLLNKDGKLHLCVIYGSCLSDYKKFAKLWRLDGDGDWTEVVTYRVPRNLYSVKPLYLMKNGNWVTVCRSGCHVNELDPANGFKKRSFSDKGNRIDIGTERILYIETLVSPNGKMN